MKLEQIAVGDKVDFHLWVGGEAKSVGHTVLEVWPKPNNFGSDVARISGRSDWVATAALTRSDDETPKAKRGTRKGERQSEDSL